MLADDVARSHCVSTDREQRERQWQRLAWQQNERPVREDPDVVPHRVHDGRLVQAEEIFGVSQH